MCADIRYIGTTKGSRLARNGKSGPSVGVDGHQMRRKMRSASVAAGRVVCAGRLIEDLHAVQLVLDLSRRREPTAESE